MSQAKTKNIMSGAVALAVGLSLMADDYDIQYPGPGETVTVGETLVATNITFGADGYKLQGTGAVQTPSKAGVGATAALNVTVPAGATAEISVPVQNVYLENFEKRGDGNLVLSGFTGGYLFRTAVYGGMLTFRDVQFDTAKFQQYPGGAVPVASLVFDGATVRPFNNNTLIGEAGFLFDSVTVEDGGLALGQNYYAIGEVRLNHRMGGTGAITKVSDATYDLRIQNEVNDLTGGWNLFCGRTYLEYAAGLGTGPVTVSNAQFYANNTMEITNRITVVSNGKIGLSGGAEQLTISDVGFTADNADKKLTLTVGLGGSADTPRTVRVKSGETPVEIGGYVLEKGESPYNTVVSLAADGDTMKATASAASPYITSPDGEAVLHVGANGVTFDTNGSDIDLGARLDVAPVAETMSHDPVLLGSFEDNEDNAGWTFGAGGGQASGIHGNDSGFVSSDPAYQTQNGSKFAVIRPNGGSLQRSFTVPESGEWKIVFEVSTRPAWDNGGLEWSLTLDPGAADETTLRAAQSEGAKHSFQRYESPAFVANVNEEHVFKIVTGASQMIENLPYDAIFVDYVRLEKIPVDVTRYGTVAKTGAGTLSVSGLETSGDVAVSGGTLALAGGALSSNTVSVASGATLKFVDSLEVAIPNASFENVFPADESKTFCYVDGVEISDATIPGWRVERLHAISGLSFSGWQVNGSAVSKNSDGTPFPRTSHGSHTAFLRPSSRLSTVVTIPEAGTYTLTFDHSARGGAGSVSWGYLLPIAVTLGEQTIATVPARDKANYDYITYSGTVELTAGTYTLAFTTGDGGTMDGTAVETASGPMVFIDAVSLVKASGFVRPTEDNTVWNFARGATFDIGSFDVELGTAFVDGVQVRGGKSAFRAAGLNVVGRGRLMSQRPAPTVIILR